MRKYPALLLLILSVSAGAAHDMPPSQSVRSQSTQSSIQNVAVELQDDAKALQEQKDLLAIRGLHFSLQTRSGAKILGFDYSKPQQEVAYLYVDNPPTDLIANYRFQGESTLHPLARDGTSQKVLVPSNVDMVVVSLVWCNGECSAAAEEGPYTCTPKMQVSSRHSVPKQSAQQNTQQVKDNQGTSGCQENVVFVRELMINNGELAGTLLPAFVVSPTGLQISATLLEQSVQRGSISYVLNGTPIRDYFSQEQTQTRSGDAPGAESYVVREALFGWSSVKRFHIDRYPATTSCQLYAQRDKEWIEVDRPAFTYTDLARDNGIMVAPSKVFDTFTLRQMLATTASQLASVTGFNQASVIGALSNLQGITRDTSFLSAQVTTVPTPTVSSVAVNGNTNSNTAANTMTLVNGTTGTSTVISCPAGTLPAVGTSGVPACVPVTSTTGAGNVNGGTSTVTGSQTSSNSTQVSANTGIQNTNQQNTVTTTSGGQAGVVAPVSVPTALPAPTNIGLSSSDMLAEQVQLNSQITTLRLLLQGALSDQYLIKNSLAVATRQQTTVGFFVSLNPPQRFKHAAAEVRVWVDSPAGDDQVSVMNLLPADKTYNVAKITSHQNQFGAGAVVEAVNVGVNTGRSKDRLYLVKDTDTVALQFPRDKPEWPKGATWLPRSVQEHIKDTLRQATIWQSLADACADPPNIEGNSVVFGWQFRPVLGGDYVEAGQRLVFAQLALPTGLGEQFAPLVHIQTRWREYDPKHRIVGAVYKESCSISEDPNPITVLSPLRVHRTNVSDMGNGLLKVSAQGNFFSSGFTVLSGQNTIAPTVFDGKSLQVFANATNLLMNDDLELLAEDGRTTDLGMHSLFGPAACGVASATLTATPRPDGTSLLEATVTSGPSFSFALDQLPKPLILIGSQVFGLHETPYIGSPAAIDGCKPTGSGGGITCDYHFVASTDTLRSARTFTVRDLAWKDFKASGPIAFGPSFTALNVLGAKPQNVTADPPPLYALSGFQFDQLKDWNCEKKGCLELYEGLLPFTLDEHHFHVQSNTTAILSLENASDPPAYDYKSLRFIWHPTDTESIEWDLSVPQEKRAEVTASDILNVGDSRQLVFSGVEVGPAPYTLAFDNVVLAQDTYKYDPTAKTLTVDVTTAMTSKPGHKEMMLSDTVPPGSSQKQKHVRLPFEVTKR